MKSKVVKNAVIIHSGGMDSSLCLALAAKEFGNENILSLSFSYGQRQAPELDQAEKICRDWKIDHAVFLVNDLPKITYSAQLDKSIPIEHKKGEAPNTLVVGRNGMMARLGAIYAENVGAHYIYMGVMELEEANSGYRDCSRSYMDLKQHILRIDLGDPSFEIRTPLVRMTKKETMQLGAELGVLEYLLANTVTCYEGISREGCRKCPACKLRNEGIRDYIIENPAFQMPYSLV